MGRADAVSSEFWTDHGAQARHDGGQLKDHQHEASLECYQRPVHDGALCHANESQRRGLHHESGYGLHKGAFNAVRAHQ